MAIDFSKLGKTRLGDIAPPPVPPAGTYHGIIRSWKWAESRWKNKETGSTEAQVHFVLKPTEFGDDIADDERQGVVLADKVFVAEQGIQTDAQVYYMQEFLSSLGIQVAGKTLDELLPETVNVGVSFDIVLRDGERGQIANVRKLRARTA